MAPHLEPYHQDMSTTTLAPSLHDSSVRSQALVAAVILAGFVAYLLWVASGHGALGFLALAQREPWAMQLLVDLLVACSFGLRWVITDARRRGITPWPFVMLTVTCGSVGLLGYVVWRVVRAAPQS